MDEAKKKFELCLDIATHMADGMRTAVMKHEDMPVSLQDVSLAMAIFVDNIRIVLQREPDDAIALLIDALNILGQKYEASGEATSLVVRELQGDEADFAVDTMTNTVPKNKMN